MAEPEEPTPYEPTPDKPQHILTVYGYGYKLVP